ncbi:MAG: hypothetical protein Q8Q56_02015, partial [Alphaproteobacteria bacterium]|nr:hypothetical protein [Alphaproteobacteria bacterium]
MRNETLKNLLLTASLISASALLTACGDKADPEKEPVKPMDRPGSLAKESDEAKKAMDDVIRAVDALAPVDDGRSNPDFDPFNTMYVKIKPAIAALNKKYKSQLFYFKFFKGESSYLPTSNLSSTNTTANVDKILSAHEEMLQEIATQKDVAVQTIAVLERKVVDLKTNNPTERADLRKAEKDLRTARKIEMNLLRLAREIGDEKKSLETWNDGIKATIADRKEALLLRETMEEFIHHMNITDGDFDLPGPDRGTLVGSLVRYMQDNILSFKESQLPKVVSEIYDLVKLSLKLSLDTQKALTSSELTPKTYAEYLDLVAANPELYGTVTKASLERFIKESIEKAIKLFEPVSFYFSDESELAEVKD